MDTAVFRSVQVMMLTSRIAGCPFVDDLRKTKARERFSMPSPIRGLLRLVYFLVCASLFSCLLSTYVIIRLWFSRPTDQITIVTQAGNYLVVYGQAMISFLNMVLRRDLLADIVLSAVKLEPNLFLDTRNASRRLWKVSLLCLLFTLADAVKLFAGHSGHIAVASLLLEGQSEHLFMLAYIASCFLLSVWYNMVFWQIVCFSSLFREYFATLARRLEGSLKRDSAHVDDGRCLAAEYARVNLVELQRLLRKVDAFVGPQALCYYAGSVFFLCGMLYRIAVSSNTLIQKVSRWSYTAAMVAGLVLSTAAVGSMSSQVSRIQSIIQASKFQKLSDAATHRLHILLLALEELRGCLTGCGMFVINLPLIVAIAGAVITYTVVLVQTNESIMGNKCLKY
ncbi:uncharacterized protein LOC142564438 [Dermacentor variabilis]|uniref:uncharacterized protein LOC142564438 n=1 Tax=Dermacentor variabilis TaxID=34621 RepID=UPI003F5BF20B